MTRRNRKLALIGVAGVAALAGGGAAIAGIGGDDDESEKPITGSARERAGAAALEHTGGGRVTGTELGDEEGYYEVEVTREDGSQVDVHLSRDFEVLSEEGDEDGPGDDGPGDD